MVDLMDTDEGVGAHLCELRTLGELLLCAVRHSPNDAQLEEQDMENLGVTLCDLAKRIEARLAEIEKAHKKEG